MLELTKEQMEVIQKAISKKAEESVQEFDKELDIVVSKLSTEGWTLPAELNIYAVKTIANTNKLDDINAFLKWFFTIEDFQKTKDMVNGIKASPIKEGLKNLTDSAGKHFKINCMLFVQHRYSRLSRVFCQNLAMTSKM